MLNTLKKYRLKIPYILGKISLENLVENLFFDRNILQQLIAKYKDTKKGSKNRSSISLNSQIDRKFYL